MLKLLFVEDDRKAIEPVLRLIKRKKAKMNCKVSKFGAAEATIASFHPDIVILDLLVGAPSPESKREGLIVSDFIWNQRFCPIVVYSAQPDIHDEEKGEHPFIKGIKKGTRSPKKVLDAIDEFLPHVEALREAESHIRQSFSCAMQHVAPYAFKAFGDTDKRVEAIRRSGRRRVAAQMDEFSSNGSSLTSWEQYLHPPISDDILLGDILKKSDGHSGNPASFRVVLTPSCDMANAKGGPPRAGNILVATCCSMKVGLDRMGLNGIKTSKLINRLSSILSQGYSGAIIPLPALEEQIPTMAANLRDLELIPIDNINTEFLRIASLDSPFRELIAWGYQQTACRPGLPDRDVDSWCKEIIENLRDAESGKKS